MGVIIEWTAGFSPEFLQLVVHVCIINNLGGLVNSGCGQLHVHELQVASYLAAFTESVKNAWFQPFVHA